MHRGHRQSLSATCVAAALLLAACGGSTTATSPIPGAAPALPTTSPALTPTPIEAVVEQATTTTSTTTTEQSTTTTSTTSTVPTTSTPVPTTSTPVAVTSTAPPTEPVQPLPDATMQRANAAFDALARNNTAASMTVVRDGVVIVNRASGNTLDGAFATPDSPMLVASVSKIVTAYAIARLDQHGDIDVNGTVPWALMGLAPNERWNDVTIRELLDHTSGMPVARQSWFGGGSDCRGFLPSLLRSGPESNRGTWRYSNGNYCALGLLIEFVTSEPLDVAIQQLVFEPIGVDGLHLTTDGLLPTDVPHSNNVGRFSRLGAAGTFVVSTEDLAAMASSTTFDDLDTLLPPGVFTDQYGWGHTGTVLGAVSCFWVFELGRTAVAATIAGNSPAKGGEICDRVVPAIADDLGIGQGVPDRTP